MQRRNFLQYIGAAALTVLLPEVGAQSHTSQSIELLARPGSINIVGSKLPATDIWGFNGQVPGTAIRIQQGHLFRAKVINELKVPTAVHWHGIRLPNKMGGVAGLTEQAIAPGASFDFEFSPPDAGTYWYHSHVNAYEQIGRGLYGPLIVEDPKPPQVYRDLIWMIDDWRLMDDASISDDFGSGHDLSHAGHLGNVPTVNGRFRDVVEVRAGERIRLRLINASNTRNFALSFGNLQPSVIAVDGQAITPYQPEDGIVIGAVLC